MKRFIMLTLLASILSVPTVLADSWPMKHRDMHNTGRADFVIPASRLNDTLFDVLRWQKEAPGSPEEGGLSSSSMVFFDGAGPAGADIVVCGYHWPKGVQGMDRHTGKRFWYGNPYGGESIGAFTPAFSNNGQTIYVGNDATGEPGHPLMAFLATTGPATYWHNGGDPNPWQMSQGSPVIAPDGRIFRFAWSDRPYGATDNGSAITHTWAAESANGTCFSGPALIDTNGLKVITGGRWNQIQCFDGDTGAELWSVPAQFVDGSVTVDPDNGNIYAPAGSGDVWVIGLDADGNSLWGTEPFVQVYDWIDGVNNPQLAASAGCLSHTGSTFFFQTVSQQGDGRLYAINTRTGHLKWSYPTGSGGWDGNRASPIVAQNMVNTNGIVFVGNNDGGAYRAIRDNGTYGEVLDVLPVQPNRNGVAHSTPTLSADGLLYIPTRIQWIVSNGDGDSPTFDYANLFNAFDLNEGATMSLPPPANQAAVALNHAAALSWKPVIDPTGQFDHYAVYRSTSPFSNVSAMTPIATVPGGVSTDEYTDSTALNGTAYHYAVTSVSVGGAEVDVVQSVGPRTPRDETDLQIASLARWPQYPRYLPEYTYYNVTEPSGYGPYWFSAATSLGGGQTGETQRWPDVGDTVTYTATLRNRGTNTIAGPIAGTWRYDDAVVGTVSIAGPIAPGATVTRSLSRTWDGTSHEVKFTIDTADARAGNNELAIDTMSVPFLTYVDVSFIEDFREKSTPGYPQAVTDDMIDWLQHHAARMNQMFADASCIKRIHYNVLDVLTDGDPEPGIDRTPYAIFPLRYYAADYSDPRSPGYYHADVDIDYGLLHEMGHQLGLVDLYRLDMSSEYNHVSGQGYSGPACLMLGCSPFFSTHSALAMNHWYDKAHGYYGQYMYCMPDTVRMRFIGVDGRPLTDATIKMYQKAERSGEGEPITTQIKAQGITDANGEWDLPNVPIDTGMVPTTYAGDTLRPNPFGYVAVIATNGLLHFRIEKDGGVDYAWLDITEVNIAYWQGQTDVAVFERNVAVGGPIQFAPPPDMTELNAYDWTAWAQGSDALHTYVVDETGAGYHPVGAGSIKFVTDGGADTAIRYPRTKTAHWDLSGATHLNVRFRTVNPNGGFQNGSPWIRLLDSENNYYQYQWYSGSSPVDKLNETIGVWRTYSIPLNAPAPPTTGWARTVNGTPSLSNIQYVEIHADTWGGGFIMWVDGLGFTPQPYCLGDGNYDSYSDLEDFALFQECHSGSGVCAASGCEPFDWNGDCDVDADDLASFGPALTGPEEPMAECN